jgi:hypothetical protein
MKRLLLTTILAALISASSAFASDLSTDIDILLIEIEEMRDAQRETLEEIRTARFEAELRAIDAETARLNQEAILAIWPEIKA